MPYSTQTPDKSHTHGKRVTRITKAVHPLDPLTEDELVAGRAILVREGLVKKSTRFPEVLPVEPDKDAVLGWKPGAPFDRQICYTLLDISTGVSREVVVSVTHDRVLSNAVLPTDKPPYGQPPYLFEEYGRVDAIVKGDPQWRAAMKRRGVKNPERAFCAPLAPGYFGFEDEKGRRMIRSLTFLPRNKEDSLWTHPVEGLVVTLDLTTGKVVKVVDDSDAPIPDIDGNYDPKHVGPARTSLKPLEITQPEGPSYSVDGSAVEWENWKFRIGFDAREGLILYQVSFRDGDEDRPVLYRASIPEMVVPYGDNASNTYWISYFDSGEYLLGKNANSLALGCDCLGVIHYFDAVVADDVGKPMIIPQTVCMHEEDFGILWKHTDFDHTAEVRRSRRLVISYIATVGNYDYGFYWYLYLDGSIQVEAKATGIVFYGAGEPGEENPHRLESAPGMYAPIHQHLFCARLDVAIDGRRNSVEEINVERTPKGPDNPYGNAFAYKHRKLKTEKQGQRMANAISSRLWRISSGERKNRVGKPTAYHLIPEGRPPLMAQPDATVSARANFATKHLWVTAYKDGELWPAGKYPNQHQGWDGLPTYVKPNRSIDDTDVVVWHTFGTTHLPRPEDYPVMPVDYSGFWFKPFGFFDRNPTLDLPDAVHGHQHHHDCGM